MPGAGLPQLAAMLRRTRFRLQRRPAVGRVRLGSLDRVSPISTRFGFDRGVCVDRFYIESFLHAHGADIRGRVLEVQDSAYTRRFGAAQVTRADVLDVRPATGASVVLDLGASDDLPTELSGAFDCVILTQTLQFIYDVRQAVANVHALLAPGGVALATVPGISQLSPGDRDQYAEYWRFTSDSTARLFGEPFGSSRVDVSAYGNVLAAVGFLHGLAVADLPAGALSVRDPNYEVIVAVRASKPA